MRKRKTIEHIKHLIDNQGAAYEPLAETRVFDMLPDLLDDDELIDASKHFLNIINKISAIENTDSGYKLLKTRDKDAVTQFYKRFIQIGCEELLDKSGSVDVRLIKIMKLPKDILTSDIVYAYYSTIHQSIIKNISNEINPANEKKYLAVLDYLYTESKKWVNEVLTRKGFGNQVNFSEEPDPSTRQNQILLAGVTSAIAIATGAFFLFKSFPLQEEEDEMLSFFKKIP